MASRSEPTTPPPRPEGLLPHQTPIAVKTATQSLSNNITENMDKVYRRLGDETKGHYLVGLEPHRFLAEFLPWNPSTPHCYRDKSPSKRRLNKLTHMAPKPGQTEKVMYQPFVDALNTWVDGKALKSIHSPKPQALRFLNSSEPDTSCKNLNPDVSTYWKRDLGRRTNFACLQTYEEFKPNVSHDPFQHELDEGPRDGQQQTGVKDADEGESDSEMEREENQADEEDADQDQDQDETEGEEEEEEGKEEDDGDEDEDEEDEEEDNDDGVDIDQADRATEANYDDVNDDSPIYEQLEEKFKLQRESPVVHKKDAASQRNLTTYPDRDVESGIHTRGQIAAYAGVALSMAFRKHLFSVLILGRYARFIRWDRRGAIVTCRFDYTKKPTLIFNFYLRYGQLDPLQRGFDPGAKLCKLPGPVKEAFRKYHESQWHGATKFKRREASRSYEGFFRIKVKDDKQNSEIFFVPPPRFSVATLFPFCRATRRSLACLYRPGVETQMCFLKDSWQVNSPRTAREAVIYQRLKDANVKNVASMRIGGDIEGFETETQEWIQELFPTSRFVDKMYCHRIILNTVAHDLSTFVWGKVLLSCIADGIEAVQEAYSAGILHRDVSAGNIMITRDKQTKQWRGIIIDWEMSLLLENEGEAPRSGRTGTWAFISAKILQNPSRHQHTLSDDIESFFWVLVYQAMRYLSHPMDPHVLYIRMEDIFYKNVKEKTGNVTGGWAKKSALLQCLHGMSYDAFSAFDKSGFNKLLDELGGILHDRYKRQGEPCFRLDDPKDSLFGNILRKAAMEMEPLCITPTALKSPTNDSKPPTDCDMWEAASLRDTKADYFPMDMSADPTASEVVQKRQQSELQSSCLHGMDGSYVSHSSKRYHVDDPAPDMGMEQSSSKRRRV